ncbi:MAG: zinc-ribbon domain-containing protein [Actinomycetota bacterium]
MECPACGAENKPDAVFCMSCGGPLPDVPFSQLEKKERVGPQAGGAPAMPGFLRESMGTQAAAEAGPPEPAAAQEVPPPAVAQVVPSPAAQVVPPPEVAQEVPPPEAARATATEDSLVTSPGGFVFNAAPPPPAEQQSPPTAPPPPAAAPAGAPDGATVPLPPAAAPAPPQEAPAGLTAPLPSAAATPVPPPAAAASRSVVEEIGVVTPAPPAPQPPAASRSVVEEIGTVPPPAAAPAGAPDGATAPLPSMAAPPVPEVSPPPAPPPPRPAYYIPPEADLGTAAPRVAPPPDEPSATVLAAPAPTQSQESTQSMAPVVAPAAATARERRSVCPECYAPNPEGNMYCQECGSALPLTGARPPTAPRPAAAQPAPQQTAVLPPAAQAGAAVPAAYTAGAQPRAGSLRGEKAFGAADVLALLAIGAGAVSVALSYVLDSFTWKKGLDIAIFSHQGAYTPGRTDLLGGPGILPYEGAEFFTVGLVVSIALALALVFLAVRVGRGPMFILSGCLMLLPAAYMFFQALLPLRQMGIDVDPALGLSGMFFGNPANAGAGLSMWIITGAGALLVLAGFIAPPRGWGRLLTFLICFSAVLGVAFFCAASYNWNLFISEPAAAPIPSGRLPLGWLASSLFMLA